VPGPGRVEGIDITGGSFGELLHHPLAQPLPRGPLDRLDRGLKRAACALDGRQPPKPMGVLLGGQVQHAIGRMQVAASAATVGDPPDLDLTEDRRQPALVSRLGAATRQAIGPDHPLQPALPLRTQVQMVLQQLPEQLPALDLKPRLQLCMRQRCRLRAFQPGRHRLEATTRSGKHHRRGLHYVCFHQAPSR